MDKNRINKFYKPAIILTFPIICQNLLSVAVSSADVLMLNHVNQASVAASSLASQYTHILLMFFYGLGTGVTMLGAQYWGKKDIRAIELVEGIALRFALTVSMVVASCCILIPHLMMKVFTNDAELIGLGVNYLRVVSISYICWGISEVYLSALRSIERVGISTIINGIALVLNICLNAVLIFGTFGAPKLGIVGVAIATSISRFTEMVLCILVSVRSKDIKLRFKAIFIRNKILSDDFLSMSLPAIINDIAWSIAFSLYSAILGHLSSDIVAANSIVTVARNFATVTCFAFASATVIWLGKKIGEGKMEEAEKDAGDFMKLTVLTGAIGGLLIFLMIPFLMKIANLNDNAMGYLKNMLYINTYYVMGAAVNTTLIAGVFRAGGDSKFGMICDIIDMWCYAVPLGFLAAFVFKLPHMVVYFLLCTDEFVKWPWVIGHYRSKKWLNNITKKYE